VKIWSVGPDLDQLAHVEEGGDRCETRAACCHRVRDDHDARTACESSSMQRLDMRAVAMGSSAEQGSSIRITSG
jgi:hypothetical protein